MPAATPPPQAQFRANAEVADLADAYQDEATLLRFSTQPPPALSDMYRPGAAQGSFRPQMNSRGF